MVAGQEVKIKNFAIKDHIDPFRALWWHVRLWPELKSLYQSTWPHVATREQGLQLRRRLQKNGSMATILRDPLSHKMIGFSMIRRIEGDDPSYVYNQSVIVDPTKRRRGLMVPLLEEQMRQASLLGFQYMWGEYNANTGHMRDGSIVQQGFAAKILGHPWNNGKITQHYPQYNDEFGHTEAIIFALTPQVRRRRLRRN